MPLCAVLIPEWGSILCLILFMVCLGLCLGEDLAIFGQYLLVVRSFPKGRSRLTIIYLVFKSIIAEE